MVIHIDIQDLFEFTNEIIRREPEFRDIPLEIAEIYKVKRLNEFRSGKFNFSDIKNPQLRLTHSVTPAAVSDGREYALGARIVSFPVYTEKDRETASEALSSIFTPETKAAWNIETAIMHAEKEVLRDLGYSKEERKANAKENRKLIVVDINHDGEKVMKERPYTVDIPKKHWWSSEKKETQYTSMLRKTPRFKETDKIDETFREYLDHLGEFASVIQKGINALFLAYRFEEEEMPGGNLVVRVKDHDLRPYHSNEKFQSFDPFKTNSGTYIFRFSNKEEGEYNSMEEFTKQRDGIREKPVERQKPRKTEAPASKPKPQKTKEEKSKPKPEPKMEKSSGSPEIDYKKPTSIVKAVQPYVVGQEKAINSLAEAVCDHYQRLSLPESERTKVKNTHILMMGPTGSGKTYVAQTVSEILGVPFVIYGLAGKTAQGYVGENIDNAFNSLIEKAGAVDKAERGIVFFDEFDKIAQKDITQRDIRGEDLQNELLKILEGESVSTAYGNMDTSNILYICGGAFDGLAEIVNNRSIKRKLGFGADHNKESPNQHESLQRVSSEDLLAYGFKKELIGRLPDIVALNQLDQDQLVEIMTTAKDSYVQGKQILFGKSYGIELTFDDSAYHAIAEEAIARGTGARAIESILTTVLKGMRESPMVKDGKLRITEDIVYQQLEKHYSNDK